jgi:hypothetical protein
MKDEFITLGHDCQISEYLQNKGLKKAFLLTDGLWVKRIGGIIRIINTEGREFFNLENLVITNKCNMRGFMTVEDMVTNITSGHDFAGTMSFEESYKNFTEMKNDETKKFFMDRLKNQDNVQIIRTNKNKETLDDIVLLHDTIQSIREDKKFDLYVFQDDKFMSKNWGVENLHTFNREVWRWNNQWEGEPMLWKSFFSMIVEKMGLNKNFFSDVGEIHNGDEIKFL